MLFAITPVLFPLTLNTNCWIEQVHALSRGVVEVALGKQHEYTKLQLFKKKKKKTLLQCTQHHRMVKSNSLRVSMSELFSIHSASFVCVTSHLYGTHEGSFPIRTFFRKAKFLHILQVIPLMSSFHFRSVYYSKDNETHSSVSRRLGKLKLRGVSSPETTAKSPAPELSKPAYIDCISGK